MLIPYNTDAPVYHFPSATVGLIVTNFITFAITRGGSPESYSTWILSYGDGLNPLEWISSLFFHMGWVHLLGNMTFLWVFGLVVEGKVGWRRFLAIYLGTGIAQNLLQQIAMEFIPTNAPGSAGASGAIFGLLAISMIWAPRNDIQCYVVALLRIFDIEIAIVTMCVMFVLLQILIAMSSGLAISSGILHLVGIVMGAILGAVMVKRDLVDCENWDLFSVLHGRHRSTVELKKDRHIEPAAAIRQLSESGSFNFTAKAQELAGQIGGLIEKKKYNSALRELRQLQHLIPEHQLSEQELGDLIRGLYGQKKWDDVRPLIREFIERFPDTANSMRLRLAAILLEVEKRPKAALRATEMIESSKLRKRQVREFHKIRRAARKLVDSGHLELDQ